MVFATHRTVSEAWRHKAQGYMSTPVVIDGVAYNHLKSQRVMAIEVETGRELWTSYESFGKYWSLVASGDRILALDQRGVLFSLRANKEKLDVLDQRKHHRCRDVGASGRGRRSVIRA